MLRRLGDEVAIVAVNNADVDRRVSLVLPADLAGARWSDALTAGKHAALGRELSIDVPALYGVVLIRQ